MRRSIHVVERSCCNQAVPGAEPGRSARFARIGRDHVACGCAGSRTAIAGSRDPAGCPDGRVCPCGLQRSPYSIFYKLVIRPRIGAPAELEDSRPPRFAQVVGFSFTALALLAFLAGATTVGLVATAFALIAATLNASIGLCLGCELYLLLRRFSPASVNTIRTTHAPHTNGGTV